MRTNLFPAIRTFASHVLALLVAFALVASTAMPADAQSAPASDSLADTDDVLDGTDYLVRADDLVLADPIAASSSTDAVYYKLLTDDMVITTGETTVADTVVTPPCQANPRPHVSPAAVFPPDTTVS